MANNPIKMRVMFSSTKKRMETFASAIAQAFTTPTITILVDNIPPAFPCEKERLVFIGVSSKDDPKDNVRRFCRELTPARTLNVALFVDGKADDHGLKVVIDTLKEAGTNVMTDDIYYLDAGSFMNLSKKITLQERTDLVKWAEGITGKIQS